MDKWAQSATCICFVSCLLSSLDNRANAQSVLANAARQSDVIYGRKYGLALTMEVFVPVRPNGLGVVWVVSSSGKSSREQTLQESFQARIAPLLDRGYTVFAAVHGSAPIFNVQEQLGDVRRAVRFVRHHASDFEIDGGRLGISGSSAGGLLALMVAMRLEEGNASSEDPVERLSSQVRAAGSFFAPTDLMNFGASSENVVDLMQRRSGNVDPSFRFFALDATTGARVPITAREDVLRMLAEFSPISHVTPDDPPVILIHGDQDKAVPLQQSHRLIERLTQSKVPARLVVREGVGHAYSGWEGDTALIADWFDEYLHRVH